jgi:hypothetical protein
MAFVVNDRVQEFTSTTGTGTLTLTGSPDGFETFSSAVGDGNTTYYTISSNTTEFEVGIGTVGAGTLSRDTVISSSNSDALVNFSAGTKNVFVTLPASKTILLNDSGTVDLTGNLDLNSNDITGTGNINITGNLTASGNLTSLGIDDNATSTAITINSSEQVEFTAGTALLPAITTTGDTNTGMWFPAADTIAFSEGGAEAMRIDSSGRVGIGTSTPSEKLVVERSGAGNVVRFTDGTYGVDVAVTSTGGSLQTGNINQTLDFKVYGNGYMGFYTSGTSERMRILSGGNVGIGTTTPDASYGKLTVAGGITIANDNNAKLQIGRYSAAVPNSYIKMGAGSNSLRFTNPADSADLMTISSSGNVGINTTAPDAQLDIRGTNSSMLLSNSGKSQYFRIQNNESADALVFNANDLNERMRIDSSGNVGIGTSSPTAFGGYTNVAANNSSGSMFELMVGGTRTANIQTSASITNIQTRTNIPIAFDINGSEKMRLTDTGFGISTTTPDAKLSVNGVASFGDGTALLPSIANFGDLNTGMWFPAADTIAFSEGGAEAMRIDSSGRVGIGTTDVNGVLNVVQASNTGALLRLRNNTADTSTADGMVFTITDASAPVGSIEMVSGGSDAVLAFRTNGSERMRIDSSGNVGIGTSSPESLFHIESASSDPTLRITNKTVAAIDTGPDIEFWNNPFTATTVNSYESGAIRVRKTNGSNNNHDHYMSFWTRQNSPEGINERMRITSSGDVFIAKTGTAIGTVGIELDSTGSGAFTTSAVPVLYVNRLTDDGDLIRFFQASTEEGSISVSGGTVSYNGFTGTHWSRFTDNSTPNILRGTVLETLDEMCDWYNLEFDVTTTTR